MCGNLTDGVWLSATISGVGGVTDPRQARALDSYQGLLHQLSARRAFV